jgi:hypothetical protein
MKTFYKSRTAWLNIVTFALAALSLPEVSGLVPVDYLRYIVAVNAIGNLYLRYEPKPAV